MSAVKNTPLHKKTGTDADTKLSMRAAREAHNGLSATLANVRATQDGLTELDAAARLQREGYNEVAHDKPPHALVQFLQALNNPFIYVLLILAGISFVTDYWLPLQAGEEVDLTKVIIIMTMVLLSSLLRFWQEHRSAKSAEALKAMVRTTATVLRREQVGSQPGLREVPMRELVAGDIVQLSAGDMIPADVRLIESRDLFISQAVLTGEALPVEKYDTLGDVQQKSAGALAAERDNLLDLPNICFMGTNVVSGRAKAVVVATGPRTYFGSLAKAIVGSRVQTAFDRGVNSVSWLLIRFMLVMVPIVFLLNGFSKGDWGDALLFALAVAVGLTPEMLPMIVSANLAKGATAMAKRKVVVKRLNAIQNFGSMDVLCTDKTGTLTQDKIILEHHVNAFGQRDDAVLSLAWLNSYHQSGLKNLMDQAVVQFSEQNPKFQVPFAYSKVDELPFDFVRRRLSIVVKDAADDHLLVCKGAVEEMLSISTHVMEAGVAVPLDQRRRDELLALANDYNEDGFRVLVVATRNIPMALARKQYTTADERNLVIQGFLTFLDPPKETAGPAIAALQQIGVAVKVLTGDNAVVTRKICRQVGLEPGEPLLGAEIEAMDDAYPAAPRGGAHSVRQADAAAEIRRAQGAASQRPHRGLPRRRDQRCTGPARCRRGHFGRQRHRHRQGIGRHHPVGKEPDGARRRCAQRPRNLRQYHEVPEHDGQLQLRQRVLGAGSQRVYPVHADACHPLAAAKPDVRHLPTGPAMGQDGQGIPGQTAQVGRKKHWPFHDLDRADLVDLRHHHLCADVVRVLCQQCRDADAVSVRLVYRRAAFANAGGAHAAHSARSRSSRARRHGRC